MLERDDIGALKTIKKLFTELSVRLKESAKIVDVNMDLSHQKMVPPLSLKGPWNESILLMPGGSRDVGRVAAQ